MKPKTYLTTLRAVLALAMSVIFVAACAPQAATKENTAPPQPASQTIQNQAPEAPAVATSRGDKLQATDPATVALASGGLQLVEFFRFT